MAELPLVEATRRALRPLVIGKRIENARILREKSLVHPDPAVFGQAVAGRIIADIERKGKYLGLVLEDGGVIWFHFMMNGQLHLVGADRCMREHTHLVLELDDGAQLRHRDPRCLSRIWLLDAGEVDSWTGIGDLGSDALGEEFTEEGFATTLARTRRPIKTCLLDQHLVAGIGNIYADEALFEAHIQPQRAGCSLDAEEVGALHAAVRHIMRAESDRLSEDPCPFLEQPGRRRRPAGWKAYGRQGKSCKICGQPLAGMRIGGRSSVYCPHCQK